MKCLIDLDGIVVNLIDPWLTCYNIEYNDVLTVKDIKDWDISRFVKPECGKKIFSYLTMPSFFEHLLPLPGAIEALKKLQDDGHEVVICSATEVPEAAKGKMIWVQKHLPFITKDNLVLTNGKHHVRGVNVVIDDSPHNIQRFRDEYGNGVEILTLTYPWNDVVADKCIRVGAHTESREAWDKILQHVATLEHQMVW